MKELELFKKDRAWAGTLWDNQVAFGKVELKIKSAIEARPIHQERIREEILEEEFQMSRVAAQFGYRWGIEPDCIEHWRVLMETPWQKESCWR
jgi:hypothetical protein